MRVLVMRTSAMGDVALLAPVIRAMREQYPEAEITILTRRAFIPFFEADTSIRIITPDFKAKHRGIAGIFRLFRDINRTGKFDCVLDLHDVIRTRILRMLFRFKGTPVYVIDKGRKEKSDLIKGKHRRKLPHTVDRYQEVFRQAGFGLKTLQGPSLAPLADLHSKAAEIIRDTDVINIAVAPYARHNLKMWPEQYMYELLLLISGKYKCRFWLLGGFEEKTLIEEMAKKIPGAESLCGKYSLSEELALIRRMDMMIAMDSSNMHMAALVGIPVISIWGGTDPVTGFGAWMQPESYSIAISHSELDCRPCTVYGKGKCRRGDLACMNWLKPEMVLRKMEESGVFNMKIR